MDKLYLKILSDIQCYIYIDCELLGTATAGTMEKIQLDRGEYWIELVSTENDLCKIQQVISLETDKVVKVSFTQIYNDLLQDSDLVYSELDRCYKNIKSGEPLGFATYDDGKNFINGIAIVRKGNLWGSINKRGEEVEPCIYLDQGLRTKEIIPCLYQNIRFFNDKLLWVMNNNVWNLIDYSGKWVAPHSYDRFFQSINGFTIVSHEGKYGLLDSQGIEVIACIYDNITTNGGEVFLAQNLEKETIDYYVYNGKRLLPTPYRCAHPFYKGYASISDGKFGIIDTNGKLVIPCVYDDIYYAGENLFRIMVNGRVGFIDINGKEVIQCKYGWAGGFRNGIVPVREKSCDEEFVCDVRFIDKFGNEAVQNTYRDLGFFSEGFCVVVKNGKIGFINEYAQEVIPCIYDYQEDFYDVRFIGGSVLLRKNGKYGFVNKIGEEVSGFKYDLVWNRYDDCDYWVVEANHSVGLVDRNTGAEVIPCDYENVEDNFYEGLCPAKKDGKWGFVDKTGNVVVPCFYDKVHHFNDGMARVQRNNKWGYVNSSGQEVIPCRYSDSNDFQNGLATVRTGGPWVHVIDKLGESITPQNCHVSKLLSSNLIAVHKASGWGCINKSFKEVVQCQYDNIGDQLKGRGRFIAVCKDKKWGILDPHGNEIIPCRYDDIFHDDSMGEFVIVTVNGKEGLLKVNETIAQG